MQLIMSHLVTVVMRPSVFTMMTDKGLWCIVNNFSVNRNIIDCWILQTYCVVSRLKMNHQTGSHPVCSSVAF